MKLNIIIRIFYIFIIFISNLNREIISVKGLLSAFGDTSSRMINIRESVFKYLSHYVDHNKSMQKSIILVKNRGEKFSDLFTELLRAPNDEQKWTYLIFERPSFGNYQLNAADNIVWPILDTSDPDNMELIQYIRNSFAKIHLILPISNVDSFNVIKLVQKVFNYYVDVAIIIPDMYGEGCFGVFTYKDQCCVPDAANFHLNVNCVYDRNEHEQHIKSMIANENEVVCPIKVWARNYEPFTFFNKQIGFFKGIEIFLMNTIAHKLNTTIEYYNTEIYINEKMYQEKDLKEMFNAFHNVNGNIIISGLSESYQTNQYFLSSVSYYEDDITWCVMRAQPIPTWQNFFCIMKDREVWAVMIGAYYVASYTFYYLMRFEARPLDIYAVMLNMLRTILNYPTPINYDGFLLRPLFIINLLTCSHILIIFNANLFTVLMSSINSIQISQISTILNGYELVGDGAALSLITQQKERFPSEKIASFAACPNIDKCLKDLEENDKLAVAVSRLHAQNNLHIARQKLFCFDRNQNILRYPVQLLMRKNFPLANQINDIIRRITESGLFIKWMSDSFVQQKSDSKGLTIQRLTTDHIIGGLLVYSLFLSFAIGAAIAEQIVYKHVKQKRHCRFWKIAECFLDNGRQEFLFILLWKWFSCKKISRKKLDLMLKKSTKQRQKISSSKNLHSKMKISGSKNLHNILTSDKENYAQL